MRGAMQHATACDKPTLQQRSHLVYSIEIAGTGHEEEEEGQAQLELTQGLGEDKDDDEEDVEKKIKEIYKKKKAQKKVAWKPKKIVK